MEQVGVHRGMGPMYLNAYLNGMQFVLLALEGKLARLDQPSKDEVIEAMYEYHELAMSLRDRLRERVAAGEMDEVGLWEPDPPGAP